MHDHPRPFRAMLLVAALSATARAQPPPAPTPPQQPAPQAPPTTPPPAAPEENWAPPPPQEAPPPSTTPNAAPPAASEPSWAPPPEEQPPQGTTPALPETPAEVAAAKAEEAGTRFEIYGFAMLDIGYDFGQIGNPLWQDVLRPTKLPAFDDEFGTGDRTFAGVRQSRLGVKASTPTDMGPIETTFEFELFGVGVDEGQTTFRLRHVYGDWWQLRAGQTWSPFMDPDVFPNSLEYWGPNGMVFFRNVQLAWMPIRGDSRVPVALERPGASPDTGIYVNRIELEDVVPRFPAPDVSAEARWGGDWGYVEAAGILRYIKWDDLDPAAPDLGGHVWGWGVNLSSNVKLGPALLKLQAVYGEAIENYMNDAGADVAPQLATDPANPLDGDALPVLGLVAFVDMEWSKLLTSTAGYSFVWVDNTSAQAPAAFHIGHYALANLQFHPYEKLMMGGELQWGRRENFDDGFDVNDFRLQFSVRFNFAQVFGGE
jgi:hypothetical protein